MNLLPPLNAQTRAELRADLEENGILDPIKVTPDGDIIDGHHRAEIAAELGIECPSIVVDTEDPIAVGIALNVHRRMLTAKQRDAIAARLVNEFGWTHRRVAKVLGASKGTVDRASTSAPNGPRRHRPGWKPTPTELARRRQLSASLRDQGASVVQISRALGVSQNAVKDDLAATGRTNPNGRRSNPRSLPREPEPIEWRDPAHIDETKPTLSPRPHASRPTYQRSITLAMWESIVTESKASHHVNRLAFDATDAEDAGDDAWLANARDTLTAAIKEATRLRAVVIDQTARLRGRREEDEQGRPLRAVK